MYQISKGKLKARMLEVFREVEQTGEPVIVTDRGREVLEIRPIRPKAPMVSDVLAEYRAGPGRGILPDDDELMAPASPEDWEGEKEGQIAPW